MSEPLAPSASLSTASATAPAGAPAAAPSTAPAAKPAVKPIGSPQTLLADSAISLLVVAVCLWKRHDFPDVTEDWLLVALAFFFPVGNLISLGLSLGAYKLRVTALNYRMAIGALFTIYYGFVALHVAGLHDSPIGALLLNIAGETTKAKLETGFALALLLLQTFIATDACQRTLDALQPPLVAPPVVAPRKVDAVTIIPA